MMADPKLSKRETDILHALQSKTSNQSIATSLGISINTVKTHLKHIYKKMDVHSKPELLLKLNQLKRQ